MHSVVELATRRVLLNVATQIDTSQTIGVPHGIFLEWIFPKYGEWSS